MADNLSSLSYTNGDIFETFAFPADVLANGDDELELLGEKFFNARQQCMESTNSGLTKLYNDFHDPAVNGAAIQQLRNLQQQISRAVCQRYGWGDIEMVCGFHAVGYLPDGSNTRFTISETARPEVLRRLSKLNETRVDQQTQPGKATVDRTGSDTPGAAAVLGHDLFAMGSKA